MPPHADAPVAPEVGVIVVNYRSSGLVAKHLTAIDWSNAPSSAVVIVDNYSSDQERQAIRQLTDDHGWHLVVSPRNVGFGAGVNLGVERAIGLGCPRFLVLNPDVSIDAPALSALVDASVATPNTLLSPVLNRPDGTRWLATGRLDRRTGLTASLPDDVMTGPDRWLSGACLLIDRQSWDRLGGFDDHYFLYWEDVDLSQRFLALGGDLRAVPEVQVVHEVGATQTQNGKSARYCFYMCRNRLLLATRIVGRRDRIRWLLHAPRYMTRVVRRHGFRASLRRPQVILAALAGTIAGTARVVRSLRYDVAAPVIIQRSAAMR